MAVVLYHHPITRAANMLWMLEEVGIEHELRYVDVAQGGQKQSELLALNPQGKLPILVDGDTVVTESVKPGPAGWGTHEGMLNAMEHALTQRDFLLGERSSMADIIFGGTPRYKLQFGMLEAKPIFVAYAERLRARPARQRATARNASIAQ